MGDWIADMLHERRGKAGSALVLGVTFKENVPDLRNSRRSTWCADYRRSDTPSTCLIPSHRRRRWNASTA